MVADATAPAEPLTLVLPAALTHAQARASLDMLLQGLRAHRGPAMAVVADATALVAFDSSALAVLLECRREALAQGHRFSVKGLPPDLGNLAKLYGVGALLASA
ncbi:STAS domain-containing protein [Ramlibacter sp. H39-3-26]|uniref:STAS domain-containing protein n=1 Tax=Curvibacter soli TaxID=3031331 RepID=UPI0023D9A828|nr:STAS domain-containing protein [Ramlibacter sp. H39-3-26]MDF1484749.1 STAS domain-containing protein [Ramlibacter sp. H39-3-26]